MSFNLLPKLRLRRAQKAERAARAEYDAARERYIDARERRDTRDKHVTFERLTEAAQVLLKAEMAARDLARSTSARTPKSARPIAALTFQGRG